ncbi:hypothetical protein F4776DRAFT_509498 [Hypoxylon sp. NC0597]|nr:hypothetical protein F4776DRAFT_509498 [Hypoxylon sp. NC0597]
MIRNYGYTNLRELTGPRPCHPHHNMRDSQRDLPQSLLFPHSLDTAAPGRQVLLRHQRVLLAPPTPPPSASEHSDYGTMKRGDEWGDGGESEMPRGRAHSRAERFRQQWVVLKQRVTPDIFPKAWLLFLVIIMIAVGTVMTSWAGLIAETVRHQTPKIIGPSSSSLGMLKPAPPDLQARAFDVALSDSQVPTLMEIESVMTMVTKATTSMPLSTPMGEQEVSVVAPLPSGPSNGLAPETDLFEDLITTVYITVTPLPIPGTSSSSSLDLSADAQHLSSSSSSSSETSSTTSTLFTRASSATSSSSTSPTTLSSSTTYSTSSTAASATVTTTASQELMYCPHPGRPDVWTICREHVLKDATSTAVHRMSNPFSALRLALVSLWSSAPASGRFNQVSIKENTCECHELERKLRAATGVIRLQQQILDDQQKLMESHRSAFAAALDFLAAVKNGTIVM